MKFEKAVVTRINVEEEDIITASGEDQSSSTCPNAIHKVTDRCTGSSYSGYKKCDGSVFVNS